MAKNGLTDSINSSSIYSKSTVDSSTNIYSGGSKKDVILSGSRVIKKKSIKKSKKTKHSKKSRYETMEQEPINEQPTQKFDPEQLNQEMDYYNQNKLKNPQPVNQFKTMKDILGDPSQKDQLFNNPEQPTIPINTKSKITSVLGTENLGNPDLPMTAPEVASQVPMSGIQPSQLSGIQTNVPRFNQTREGPKMTELLGDVTQDYNHNKMQPNMMPQMQPNMMGPQMMPQQMMPQQMMGPQMMPQQMMPQQMMPQMAPNMMPQMAPNMMGADMGDMNQMLGNNQMAQQLIQSGYNGPVTNVMMENMGMLGGNREIKGQRPIVKNKKDLFFLNPKLKQKGGRENISGDGIQVLPYDPRFTKNTPFKTQEQKKIEASRYEVKKEPATLLEFKVNENIMGKQQKPQQIYPAPFVPVGPSVQNLYMPNPYAQNNFYIPDNRYPYTYDVNQIPVINSYNIQLPGVIGDHAGLYKIFEDILPGDEYSNTYNTLEERLRILYNLRSNLVRHNDGELIGLTGVNTELRNLLSYIQMMEINPYHIEDDIGRNNPYRDLPSNMLIFRSCYPLQVDAQTNNISCSKNSIGMNVRVYEMRVADFFASELTINKKMLDLWREIYYYEYMREEILKKKVSQNFVMLYSYYLSNAEGLNFNKLRELRSMDTAPEKASITGYDEIKKELDMLVKTAVADPRSGINITLPTDKVLVALTEGPNMPLQKWAMKQYQSNGPINKMIFTGFHDETHWQSVLFQIMAAFYTMEVHKISFTNFSLHGSSPSFLNISGIS
jgi:hypothetical protein